MRWSGSALHDLLTLSIEELLKKYPEQNKKNLIRRKQEKEREMAIERREYIEDGQIVSEIEGTWEVGAFDHEAGEWNVKTLNRHSIKRRPLDENIDVFEPVEPAKIRLTRRRVAQEAFKRILVYGDGQVDYRRIIDPITDKMELLPLHNVMAHEIIKQMNAYYQPETSVNLGDFWDASALSTFAPDSDHFHKTIGPALRYIHDFYAQMRADNPDGHHVEVDSNHAVRVKKRVLERLPAMHDVVRPGDDYPVMTYYHLANLKPLGVDFVSGYGGQGGEFVYNKDNNPIIFKHGTHSSGTPGATVRKELQQNPNINIVRGHGHHDEEVRSVDREGKQYLYKMLGSTCLNNGTVPGYSSAVDDRNRPVVQQVPHQSTIMMIKDYENGHYNFETIDIIDGRAMYDGRMWDGNS